MLCMLLTADEVIKQTIFDSRINQVVLLPKYLAINKIYSPGKTHRTSKVFFDTKKLIFTVCLVSPLRIKLLKFLRLNSSLHRCNCWQNSRDHWVKKLFVHMSPSLEPPNQSNSRTFRAWSHNRVVFCICFLSLVNSTVHIKSVIHCSGFELAQIFCSTWNDFSTIKNKLDNW